MKTALFPGDVTYDLYVHISHVPMPDEKLFTSGQRSEGGGVVANAAVACSVAGTPARALLQVADDVFAARALDTLKASGVDVATKVTSGFTTSCIMLIEPHGEKRLLLTPGVSMYPTLKQVEQTDMSDIGWVHTAIYDPRVCASLLKICREREIPFSLDLEPATFAYASELAGFVKDATVLFCNTQAARKLGADPAGTLMDMGARAIVFTEGADGATWVDGKSSHHVEPPPGQVVDTTGAGDCLAGSLVARLVQGDSPRAALLYAVTAATMSCAEAGSQSSYHSSETVLAELNWSKFALERNHI